MYKADIMALQEIQADHWKEFLEPELEAAGYQGVYKQKTRESMGQVRVVPVSDFVYIQDSRPHVNTAESDRMYAATCSKHGCILCAQRYGAAT